MWPLGLIQRIIPAPKIGHKCLAGTQPGNTQLCGVLNIFLEEQYTVVTYLVKPWNLGRVLLYVSKTNSLMLLPSPTKVAFPYKEVPIKREE